MTHAPRLVDRPRDPGRITLALRRRLLVPRRFGDGWVRRWLRRRNRADRDWRRRLVAELETGAGLPEIDPVFGARSLSPENCAALGPALDRACELMPSEEELSRRAEAADKRFLLTVREDQVLLREPALAELALDPGLLRMAGRYLGEAPYLGTIRMWWTPPNTTRRSSQRVHRDEEGDRQLKLFVNLTSVEEDCGPFTWYDARTSEEIARATGFRGGRLDDEALARSGRGDDARPVLGPAGAGLIIDTSRCFHFGSRGNRRPRGVLMLQYLPVDAPRARYREWEADDLIGGDPFRAAALGYAM